MKLQDMFSAICADMQASDLVRAYFERHGIRSAPHLTIQDDEMAALVTQRLASRIRGKSVVEIGGGIGLLSLHMAKLAKRIVCIEANPMWSLLFSQLFLERKPRNLSFIFGAAEEFVGVIKADVAIICTHSDVAGMKSVASNLAVEVVDVYGEMIEENPEAFDGWAVAQRKLA